MVIWRFWQFWLHLYVLIYQTMVEKCLKKTDSDNHPQNQTFLPTTIYTISWSVMLVDVFKVIWNGILTLSSTFSIIYKPNKHYIHSPTLLHPKSDFIYNIANTTYNVVSKPVKYHSISHTHQYYTNWCVFTIISILFLCYFDLFHSFLFGWISTLFTYISVTSCTKQ